MSARFAVAAICLLATVAVCRPAVGADEQKPDEQKASFWMKKKLEYTEAILTGMTSGNFDQIAKNARSMNALGQLEKWVRANSSEYRAQLKIFTNANKQLIEMADAENLDGAAAAYVQLTLSCVNCHKLVRDHARAAPASSK